MANSASNQSSSTSTTNILYLIGGIVIALLSLISVGWQGGILAERLSNTIKTETEHYTNFNKELVDLKTNIEQNTKDNQELKNKIHADFDTKFSLMWDWYNFHNNHEKH